MNGRKAIGRELLYEGKVVKFVKYSTEISGRKIANDIVEHPGAVVIVPMTTDRCIVMVKQFRLATKDELIELPAGTIEKNESPENCAMRELTEETGYVARKMERSLEFFVAPGYSNEKIIMYRAQDVLLCDTQKQDEDESIEVLTVKLDEALRLIRNGKIRDAKTIIGLYALALKQ
jgi:ADP-ribose pyrophosphatase